MTLSAPNVTHQAKCEQQVADVERSFRDATGRAVKVRWETADGEVTPTVAPAQPAPPSEPADEHDEPDDSQPALAGGPSVLERVSQAFPGATLVGEDD